MEKELCQQYRCGVEITLDVIGGKWKGLILWHLRERTLRFSQLKRRLHGITQKMLTSQLRDLEHNGLVHREVYAEVPPKVEYSLTPTGQGVVPILQMMCTWGQEYAAEFQPETVPDCTGKAVEA